MKKFTLFCLSVLLAMSTILMGEEISFQKITEKSQLPESFCNAFEEGDYLVSDGKYLILIGGTSRNLQSILNYPAGDAMGSIIGFAPVGKNLAGNVLAGPPIVWIGEERQEVKYSTIQPISEKGAEGSKVIEAIAPFQGDSGEKAQITTRYRISSQSGKIEMESNIKNTGKSPIQNLHFSLYVNGMHSYSFRPFHREKHPDLNFRIYQKKGHFLGYLDQNPLNPDNRPVPGTLARV